MEKHKAINQNGSNRESSPVRKQGKKGRELTYYTVIIKKKRKRVDKNKDALKESTENKCIGTTLKIPELHSVILQRANAHFK